MESGSLSSRDFASYASKEVVPYLHVTSRIQGNTTDGIFREYGGTGFPTLLFLDADGNKLAKVAGADRNVEGFRKTEGQIARLLKLRDAAASGKEGTDVDLLLLELEMGLTSFTSAQEARAGLDAPKKKRSSFEEKVAKIDNLLLNLEINEIRRSAGRDPEKRKGVEITLYEFAKDGRIPASYSSSFWFPVMEGAKRMGDATIFAVGMKLFREQYDEHFTGPENRVQNRYKKMEEDLAKIKEKGASTSPAEVVKSQSVVLAVTGMT